MKRYEAKFKSEVYEFRASGPLVAHEIAKAYRDSKHPGQKFILTQIGL